MRHTSFVRRPIWEQSESDQRFMSTQEPPKQPDEQKWVRREVAADLVEATPGRFAITHWILASPFLLLLAWFWRDLFHLLVMPTAGYWLSTVLALICFIGLIVLPLGFLAHRVVLSLPRLFHNAGWELEPLEPVSEAEQYFVRYRYQGRRWAPNNWHRAWLRAAQGWVFLEMAAILLSAIIMIPLYFSAREFGFGQ